MQFELLKEKASVIKAIGIGGGGGNAVNHMYQQGITGVDFIVCNTDAQALELSPIPNKIQLGASLTEGMGAGSIPEVGRNAAIENMDDIKQILGGNTKMLFITAGMGGGTGTGASPIIAQVAKELDILTVAIVTTPFSFEGKRRKIQAEEGLKELKKSVDSFLVISNDRLREIFGNLTLGSAFAQADNILTTAAKGIAEIITIPGYINVDFKDVHTVMKDSGVAIMGNYAAEGDNRAHHVVEGALTSPLLKDSEIGGARYILLNITSGEKEVTMDEVSTITNYIQEEAGLAADLIWGNCRDERLGEKLSVTIIATGFQTKDERDHEQKHGKKIISTLHLDTDLVTKQTFNFNKAPINKEGEQILASHPVGKSQATRESKQMDLFTSSQEPEAKNIQNCNDNACHQLFPEGASAKQDIDSTALLLKTAESEVCFDPKNNVGVEGSRQEKTYVGPLAQPASAAADDADIALKEQLRKSRERIIRLKSQSSKLRTSTNLHDLETIPAYKRKEIALKKMQHSSETSISRLTFYDNDGKTEIRPNNSFLHDNVD